MDIQKEISLLRKEIEEHNYNYYVCDAPTISDFEYDELMRKLISLEEQAPELITADSPTQRVGGKVLEGFETVRHEVPLESLTDVFSDEELALFYKKLEEQYGSIEYTVEPKVDGLSVSLIYEDGIFTTGATRGDGLLEKT